MRAKQVAVLFVGCVLLILPFQNCTTKLGGGGPTNSEASQTSPLSISPLTASVQAGNEQPFFGSGGAGSYTFTVSSGCPGTINFTTGVFTAGQSAGNCVVTVYDASGASYNASVTVTAGSSTGTVTYSWSASGFGACSATCGGGTQTQTVNCVNNSGTVVSASNCTGAEPATSEACNTQACPCQTVTNSATITQETAADYQAAVDVQVWCPADTMMVSGSCSATYGGTSPGFYVVTDPNTGTTTEVGSPMQATPISSGGSTVLNGADCSALGPATPGSSNTATAYCCPM